MHRSRLPLTALRAFEVSARLSSFSKAAADLCVTHSAVSQQIKQLEALLGQPLFLRSNKGVQLTPAGQDLLPVLAGAFDSIGSALDSLRQEEGKDRIAVTTTPALASKWLMPRLRRWYAGPEALPIHLQPTLDFLDIAAGEADVSIRCGAPPWPGLESDFLLPIDMSPLCSPALLKEGKELRAPRDVLDFTLIHADIAGHALGEEWRTWMSAVGLDVPDKLEGLSFHDPNLALQAAADGLGIAMGYSQLATQEIAAGRLVFPFPQQVRHCLGYHLVYPTDPIRAAKSRAFREWLLTDCQAAVEG